MLGSPTPGSSSTRDPSAPLDIPELGQVKVKHVVAQSQSTKEDSPEKATARAILILNQPLPIRSSHTVSVKNAEVEGNVAPENVQQKQAETALIVLPPSAASGGPCVRALMHGEGTFTAPDGYCRGCQCLDNPERG